MSILRDITIYSILRSYAEQNEYRNFSQNRHNLKTLRLVHFRFSVLVALLKTFWTRVLGSDLLHLIENTFDRKRIYANPSFYPNPNSNPNTNPNPNSNPNPNLKA